MISASGRCIRKRSGPRRIVSQTRSRKLTRATFTTRSDVLSSRPPSAYEGAYRVEDFALTPAERLLFAALDRRGVPFIIIGMGAAVLEGAPIATQDLDIWFERSGDERIPLAASDAGG